MPPPPAKLPKPSLARKRPNPSPAWFGFHELFHAFTIAAYLVQFVAVAQVATG